MMTTTTTTNWHRVAAIGLSVCAAVALCYPGQLMDELPRVYVDRLNTLKFVLALNDNWSAVWSETLTRHSVAGPPDAKFCVQLVPDDKPEEYDENGEEHTAAAASSSSTTTTTTTTVETYDPFGLIAAIVNTCWYSGMFVKYGLRVLGHAANCVFCRHALLHITAVDGALAERNAGGQELNDFLRRLIDDYHTVVEKLAVVGAPLHDLLQVVTYLNDVNKLTDVLRGKDPKRAKEMRAEIRRVSAQLREELTVYRSTYCAVVTDEWYDVDTGELVKLTLDGDGDGSALARADDLRSLMHRVFDGLLASGMSQNLWKEIFANNIFVKAADLQTTGNTTRR